MNEENKSFLEKIQSLDRKTKGKLIIVLTIIIMFFIIFIWGAYFNFIIAQYSDQSKNEVVKSNLNEKLKIIGSFTFQSLKGVVNYFQGLINSPKEYIIK